MRQVARIEFPSTSAAMTCALRLLSSLFIFASAYCLDGIMLERSSNVNYYFLESARSGLYDKMWRAGPDLNGHPGDTIPPALPVELPARCYFSFISITFS